VALLCLVVPFLVAAAFEVQRAVPQDTLFGPCVHTSGFALPLVILGFSGQWAMPLLTAMVSGDIFSSEDHFGTWKTVLTRSRSRGQTRPWRGWSFTTGTSRRRDQVVVNAAVGGSGCCQRGSCGGPVRVWLVGDHP
jgi:hypothetical protein